MNPFERIAKRYQTLPKVDLAQERSIAYSRSTTRRLMELIDANAHGNVLTVGDVQHVIVEAVFLIPDSFAVDAAIHRLHDVEEVLPELDRGVFVHGILHGQIEGDHQHAQAVYA